MISLATIWGFWSNVSLKTKLYAGAAIVIVFALLRWRAAGINAALREVERKDAERAQRLRERIAVARSKHPDGDDDIIERLRDYGQLREDDHDLMHGAETRSSNL